MVNARQQINPGIGSSPDLALTFTTLDPRMIDVYFEYIHTAERTPEAL